MWDKMLTLLKMTTNETTVLWTGGSLIEQYQHNSFDNDYAYIFRSMNIECVNIFENQDSKSNYFPFQH